MNDIRRFLDIVNAPLTEGVAIHNVHHLAAFAVAVAEAYDAAPRFVESDRKPWDILNQHNNEVLFKRIEGSGVHVAFTPNDPYDDGSGDVGMMVRRMLWDMVMNNRLLIYSGHSDDHPVFSPKDNVIFRTVHDYYTHGKLRAVVKKQAQMLGLRAGAQPSDEDLKRILPHINLTKHGNVGHAFTIRGELNSYNTHRKLAPPAAAPALFTEIVGQVCYNVCVGDFPQQKVVILRDFDFENVGLAHDGTRGAKRMDEVMKLLSEGAETIKSSIKAKPVIVVAELLRTVSRNNNTFNTMEGTDRPLGLLRQLHEMVSLPVELDEASMARIIGHLEKGTPFIQLSAARAGLSQRQIHARNKQVIAALRAFHLGPIDTFGGWDEYDPETGKRNRVREESLFVPLSHKSDLSGDELLELGEFLGRRFNQDAIIYGDGENVFVVDYVHNKIDHIGTYDTVDMHEMPFGWTAVKQDRKSDGNMWAWTFPDEDHAKRKAARKGSFADLDRKASRLPPDMPGAL